MLNLSNKIKKAFTLAEVFIAMVILSVLVGVCMSFFSKQKDVEREYFYYSAYQNIAKVVENALSNEAYKVAATPRTKVDNCQGRKCVVFQNTIGTLCNVFADYFNTVGTVNCGSFTATPWANGSTPSLTLTNGMQFYFSSQAPAQIADLYVATEPAQDFRGWTFWVDINGDGNGYDKENYDIMKFYVTYSGKVIPDYGAVEGIRGYEFLPVAGLDAAGNSSLMAFDVVYTEATSNVLTVLNDNTRHTDFRTAACTSGYIHQSTPYCAAGTGYNAVTKDATKCEEPWADCKIRLVQKLKRAR